MQEWELVRQFEKEIAEFAGAKYGIAVESCTAALFLCCKYLQVKWVHIPRHTYPSVPCSIIHSGARFVLLMNIGGGSINYDLMIFMTARNDSGR